MKRQLVLAIDLILLIGTVGAVIALFLFGFNDNGISLSPDSSQDTSTVLFQFEGVSRILVDDNTDLSTPVIYEVSDRQIIEMKEGVYYWGLETSESIEIRRFEIGTPASFKLLQTSDGVFSVVNSGRSLKVTSLTGEGEEDFVFEGGEDA